MASFVAEVLSSAALLEKDEILDKLSTLGKKTEQMKMDVHELATKKYADFDPCYTESSHLADGVQALSREMDNVSVKIESEIRGQLNISTGEFQSLTRELHEISAVMTVVERLAKLQDLLEAKEVSLRDRKYSEAAQCLKEINSLLENSVHERDDEMSIVGSLRTAHKVQTQKLIYDLGDVWKEFVSWTTPDAASGSQCELRLTTGDSETVVREMVVAMEMLNVLDLKVKHFGDLLLNSLIKPLVTNENVELRLEDVAKANVISLVVIPEEKAARDHLKVLVNVQIILKFLYKHFMKVQVAEDSKVTLMELLGRKISAPVVDMIVKECLSRAIPTNRKDMEHFQDVVQKIELFQTDLLAMRFLHVDNTVLIDYVKNVDVLFANKKCQEILEQVRQMMMSEIHNTTLVSSERPLAEIPALDSGPSNKKTRKVEVNCEVPLSGNTFKLPTCHISTSMNSMMTLAYETLHEAVESSPQCAIQLFYAVRNIFELYCSVFPTYHMQSLASLPQLTALYHNNCMFIAHHLMILGHQFSKKLPPSLNATFVDLIFKIKSIGTKSFLEQLSTQKAQITEFLKGANEFNNVCEDEHYFSAERSIKQCVHQLTHLQNVWQEVLPVNIYRKAMGMLMNTMMVEIIDYVTALEDISTDDAHLLHTLLSFVLEKFGPLFNTPTDKVVNFDVELLKNVASGRKFKELHLVLNASLQEISDRWAEMKGPLALDFSANEIKQLIRALFQNTDRRAAVLSKIK